MAPGWPGNIRELETVIKNYVILDFGEGGPHDLTIRRGATRSAAHGVRQAVTISSMRATREAILDMERRVMFEALQENNWNRKKAARSRFYKMRPAGLGRKRAGDSGETAGGELTN